MEVVENSKKNANDRSTRPARQKQQETKTDPTINENQKVQQMTLNRNNKKLQLPTPCQKKCKSVDSKPKQQDNPAETFIQDKLNNESANDEISKEFTGQNDSDNDGLNNEYTGQNEIHDDELTTGSVSKKTSFTTLEKDVAENKKTILEKLNMIMNEKRNKFLALQRKFKVARQTVLKANIKGKDVENIKCFVCKTLFQFGNYMCEHGRSFTYPHASVCKECGRIFQTLHF
ncbi:KRAB [Mytilus edulis]|uniref:KRAB n=1 Tax=Mytilus edulis TaxID=6550 RepID=A0A8S3RET7_MYTED|nr:KRAB [Mytilus edulis]